MDGFMKRGLVSALAATAVLALAGPATAGAAKQVYAPGAKAHTLNGGSGGWKATDTEAGPLGQTLCIVSGVLICPSAESSYQSEGGAKGGAGDGYVSTDFSVLVGVAGSGTSVWQSKQFTYRGVNGKKAKRLKFKVSRQSDLTELLALPNSSARYAAEIVPAAGGNTVAVGDGAIPASSDWTKLQKGAKGQLKRGRKYSLRITSTYETGVAGVIEDGSVGYDNPRLVAKRHHRHH